MAPLKPYERKIFYGLNLGPQYAQEKNGFLEASDLKNILLDRNSGYSVRPGRNKQNPSAEVTNKFHSLDYFVDFQDIELLVGGTGDEIQTSTDNGATWAVSKTGLSYNRRSQAVPFLNFLWRVDGNQNLKFDGTTWTAFNIPKPTAAPVVALDGAGLLSHTLVYTYVYVYKQAAMGYESESAAAPESDPIVAASNKVKISVLADPTGEADSIRIYRESTTMPNMKQVVADLTNTDQDYVDNILEDDLDADLVQRFEGLPIDSDGNEIALEGIAVWQDRLWAHADNKVYHTAAGNPGQWFSADSDQDPYDMDRTNDKKATAIFVFGNQLVAWTDSRMYSVLGNTEETFQIVQRTDDGCIAQRSPDVVDGRLFWLGRAGVKSWSGAGLPRRESKSIDADFQGNGNALLDAEFSALQLSAAIYIPDDHRYWLSVARGSSLFNSRTFVFDTEMANRKDLSAWTFFDFGVSDFALSPGGKLYSGNLVDGFVRLERFGTTDDGSEVQAYYQERHHDFGDNKVDKRLLKITAQGFTTSTTPINVKTNYTANTPNGLVSDSDNFDLAREGALYGTGVYGTDTYAGLPISERTLSCPKKAMGQQFAVLITLVGDSTFSGYSIIFNKSARRQI